MRIIGHIPSKTSAATFSDYLYVQGIANQLEQEKDGWAIWIHSEDEMQKARSLLSLFLANPNDPTYRQKAKQASELKEREQQEEEEAAEKQFDRTRTFSSTLPYGLGWLTASLIGLSVIVTILYSYELAAPLLDRMVFSHSRMGAPEILKGEFWRLITPIFFHASLLKPFGFLHLFFNVLWMYSLGSVLELRMGTRWFLFFTLIIAALSNSGEYLFSGPGFGGLSGVVYGFLGFIWIKGKFDPNFDLALPSQTVTMMLAWYFLCLFHIIPNVANTVHTVGLLTGMAWGYLSSLRSTR